MPTVSTLQNVAAMAGPHLSLGVHINSGASVTDLHSVLHTSYGGSRCVTTTVPITDSGESALLPPTSNQSRRNLREMKKQRNCSQ